MVGEVMRLRQLVLTQSRKPPAVESAIAVVSQHLLAELKAGIKAEKGNPNRLSLESLAAFNTAGWTESHSATMPTLRRLVHALQLPWGNAAEGVEPGYRGNRVKRLAAVSSALSSLMHAVNLNFCSQLGHLQSWGVYCSCSQLANPSSQARRLPARTTTARTTAATKTAVSGSIRSDDGSQGIMSRDLFCKVHRCYQAVRTRAPGGTTGVSPPPPCCCCCRADGQAAPRAQGCVPADGKMP